ncbi:MAG: KpsF/GutQ family sugar-phosphate isomerase [Sporolactobacillus sp.]
MTSQITKKKADYFHTIFDVLDNEAKAIIALKERLDDQLNQVIDLLLQCDHRVIVTGMGKSGHIGRKIAATLASTGTPSFFLHPAEGIHGDLGMVTDSDVVIAISNSGETDEILNLLPSIKHIGAKLVALTGASDSTLASKSDFVISIGYFEEACPFGLVPTTSTTVTLALGDALAVALLEARHFNAQDFALLHPGGSLGRKLLLTVATLLDKQRTNPVTQADRSVKDVLFEITQSGLGAISIVDREGQLVGILTDGDIRRALMNDNGYKMLDQSINMLYARTPVTITEDKLAAEALRLMEKNKVNVLPVIDDKKRPVGMLHIQNLTKLGL